MQAFTFLLILGFPLAAILAWAFELTPDGFKREHEVERSQSITHETSRKLDFIIIGVLVLALSYLAYDKLVLSGARDAALVEATTQAVSEQAATEEANVESDKSIAVLPFVNMSDDASNEFFSDGISEELLNLLTKIPELRVSARTSSFSFKGQTLEIPEIAARLNVAHVLEGSVRKSGNQVRITAQLIKADDGFHLWSETYDRTLDDIFAIQDEIAGAVVDALKLTLLGDTLQVEQINPEAYALYLQASYVGTQGTAEAEEQSIAMLKQVLVIAPDYAKAWRKLAVNYSNQVVYGRLPRDEGEALAREALKQALASDPYLAEAHSMLGIFAWYYDRDLAAAARHIEYALSLEPTNLIILQHSHDFLLTLGRLDEAIPILEYLVAHNPLDPRDHQKIAGDYWRAGRPDKSIASIRTALMLAPGMHEAHAQWGVALLLKGENAAALKAMQQEPDEGHRLEGLVMAYHALGQAAESDTALTELIEKYEQQWAYFIAAVLAYRGEADRAFAWLDKAVQSKTVNLNSIVVEPRFTNIYDDPRWLPFLESIGMSPAQLAAIEFEVTLPE
jgi:TolB-like protein/Tfp pilus assembly protein PilF